MLLIIAECLLLDLIIQCTDDPFNQPGYRMYSALEALLVKGRRQVEHQDGKEVV